MKNSTNHFKWKINSKVVYKKGVDLWDITKCKLSKHISVFKVNYFIKSEEVYIFTLIIY